MSTEWSDTNVGDAVRFVSRDAENEWQFEDAEVSSLIANTVRGWSKVQLKVWIDGGPGFRVENNVLHHESFDSLHDDLGDTPHWRHYPHLRYYEA